MNKCLFSLQQHFNACFLIQKHAMPCVLKKKTLKLFMIAQSVVTNLFSLQFPMAIG